MNLGDQGILLLFLFLGTLVQMTQGSSPYLKNFYNHDECDEELKLLGIEEMVRHVERAIDECELVTVTRGELFRCFFKRVNMTQFSDPDAYRHDFNLFLQGLFPPEILKGADGYTSGIRECAETTKEGGLALHSDLNTVHQFLTCFYNETTKLVNLVREYCKWAEDAELVPESTTKDSTNHHDHHD